MKTVEFIGAKYQLPASFDELTPEQLILLGRLNYQKKSSKEILQQMSFALCKMGNDYGLLTIGQRLEIESQFNWLVKNFTMEKWLVSSIEVNGEKFYGPKNKLTNVNGEEFPMIEYYFNRFNSTRHAFDLLLFVASLYRPKTKTGNEKLDVREEILDEEDIEARANLISSMDMSIAYAIYLNYIGIREQFPIVFKELYKGAASGSSADWQKVYTNLSRSGIGSINEVAKMSIWNILNIMNTDMKGEKNV